MARRAVRPKLPGDPAGDRLAARIIRVDHAGEYGAKRIYDGQLAVLGDTEAGPAIREMAAAEAEHLAQFDETMVARDVRPSALQPFWHVAGYALGAATALMGVRAAMACTAAIEEVIEGHYQRQAESLGTAEPGLRHVVEAFRADEIRHHDVAVAHGAEQAPAYRALTGAIKAGCRAAIWLAERV